MSRIINIIVDWNYIHIESKRDNFAFRYIYLNLDHLNYIIPLPDLTDPEDKLKVVILLINKKEEGLEIWSTREIIRQRKSLNIF